MKLYLIQKSSVSLNLKNTHGISYIAHINKYINLQIHHLIISIPQQPYPFKTKFLKHELNSFGRIDNLRLYKYLKTNEKYKRVTQTDDHKMCKVKCIYNVETCRRIIIYTIKAQFSWYFNGMNT